MQSKLESKDKVSPERWNQAQNWEKRHWEKSQRAMAKHGRNLMWKVLNLFGAVGKYRGDDWNLWWKNAFNGYSFLPTTVGTALEAGCGPYTNMRHITEVCRPDHLFLSDPLIKTYVNFKLNFVSDAYRKGFCMLDDFPLENLPYKDAFFDLTVMINVLDHVMDAEICMRNIQRVVKPGGWLIIAQDLTDEEDLENRKAAGRTVEVGDTGHPITLAPKWFDHTLNRSDYETVIDKILPREAGRSPEHHCGTFMFAGRRKSNAV